MITVGFDKNMSDGELKRIAGQYPWFSVAVREYCARSGSPMPVWLSLCDDFRPLLTARKSTLAKISARQTQKEEYAEDANNRADSSGDVSMMDIIDAFIEKGDSKIMIGKNTPDSLDTGELEYDSDFDDDMLTEEMAEIYLLQGLKNKAIKIYDRLSLLNPEKSVYFAEIIAKAKEQNKV